MGILQEIGETLDQVRAQKPLVHHLTNFVTVNDCANMALAIGASPVMANDQSEVEAVVSRAAALVINIGVPSTSVVEAMVKAARRATELGIPVILDPVGVGATPLRTAIVERIIAAAKVTVIRGNISEIRALVGLDTGIRGVDAVKDEGGAITAAGDLSRKLGCVVAVTGKTDIIAQGDTCYRISNGHELLASVTGTGCMATTLIGCCCGVAASPLIGAAAGVAVMGIAGEVAQRSLRAGEGSGTFRMRLFDAVYNMRPEDILKYGCISQI